MVRACPQITWMLLAAHTQQGSWLSLCMSSFQWMLKHYDSYRLALSHPFKIGFAFNLTCGRRGASKKRRNLPCLPQSEGGTQYLARPHGIPAGSNRSNLASFRSSPNSLRAMAMWLVLYKVLGSTRALAMHAVREHGYKKKVHYYVNGDICPQFAASSFTNAGAWLLALKNRIGVAASCRHVGHRFQQK